MHTFENIRLRYGYAENSDRLKLCFALCLFSVKKIGSKFLRLIDAFVKIFYSGNYYHSVMYVFLKADATKVKIKDWEIYLTL